MIMAFKVNVYAIWWKLDPVLQDKKDANYKNCLWLCRDDYLYVNAQGDSAWLAYQICTV